MRSLLLVSILYGALVAEPLQQVANSFSVTEKKLLLEEFYKSSSDLYANQTYSLKEGWNKLTTPKDGVDVIETFSNSLNITYVVTYDPVSKLWAVYAKDKHFRDMLYLKYLEPNSTFFVLATKDVTLEIKSNVINDKCYKYMSNKSYETLVDSGIHKNYSLSEDKSISLQSRYFSHHERGVFNDTRVMLIYPRQEKILHKMFKYGPGYPKVSINYDKLYEGQSFYLYHYREEKCFKGIFPSKKIPPFAKLSVVN